MAFCPARRRTKVRTPRTPAQVEFHARTQATYNSFLKYAARFIQECPDGSSGCPPPGAGGSGHVGGPY